MRNLVSKNSNQKPQDNYHQQQAHQLEKQQHFSRASASTSWSDYSNSGVRALKRLNETPITGPVATNSKRTNKLIQQPQNQPHTILTTNGGRLTFCQPSTSLPSTYTNSFSYSNSQGHLYQNTASASNFNQSQRSNVFKKTIGQNPNNGRAKTPAELGQKTSPNDIPRNLRKRNDSDTTKKVDLPEKVQFPALFSSPPLPNRKDWSPASLKTPETPFSSENHIHISPSSFFYVRQSTKESPLTAPSSTLSQFRFSGEQFANGKSARSLTTMARLAPSGRPVNRVLDLSTDSSSNFECVASSRASHLDDSGYSSILNYSSNSTLDLSSSNIDKIETPSKGLDNVENTYIAIDEVEIARDSSSFLASSACNSTTTSPLKDNTLLLNMNDDFFGAQHSSNAQEFLNLSNLDVMDELMYGNVSLNSPAISSQSQQFNIKKSPIKFSPLKLQKPNKKPFEKKKISQLPIINTIFGPLFKGQNIIVEWDLEEEDSFSLEYLFAEPGTQEWHYMVGESEEQLEISLRARRIYKRFYRKIRPFNSIAHSNCSTLPTLALLNELPSKHRQTLSAGLSTSFISKDIIKVD